ncbi:MAG TPA: DegV family protein [Anaerolineae bacterium]|nr:DegV family protein [Anaerolineae bacterium]
MKIVTDSGVDVILPPGKREELGLHVLPLTVTLEGKSYREGVDIEPGELYGLLESTGGLPTTSQPSVGEFVEVYRRLAADDPDILSIHISSGLSGTLNSAQAAGRLVPEANITYVDTRTLSVGSGWQVEAAARAARAGWPVERIVTLVGQVGAAVETSYTLQELKYLIHGGRISHLKGMIASLLNLKPMIGVEKVKGTYIQLGAARSFKGALRGLVDLIAHRHPEGSELRVQVVHAQNPEGADMLRELVDRRFVCTWLPTGVLSLVLGAHTGPSLVGLASASGSAFSEVP